MIKMLCDRCGKEIQAGEKCWCVQIFGTRQFWDGMAAYGCGEEDCGGTADSECRGNTPVYCEKKDMDCCDACYEQIAGEWEKDPVIPVVTAMAEVREINYLVFRKEQEEAAQESPAADTFVPGKEYAFRMSGEPVLRRGVVQEETDKENLPEAGGETAESTETAREEIAKESEKHVLCGPVVTSEYIRATERDTFEAPATPEEHVQAPLEGVTFETVMEGVTFEAAMKAAEEPEDVPDNRVGDMEEEHGGQLPAREQTGENRQTEETAPETEHVPEGEHAPDPGAEHAPAPDTMPSKEAAGEVDDETKAAARAAAEKIVAIGKRQPKTARKRLKNSEIERLVWMRQNGNDWETIAAQLGITEKQARTAYNNWKSREKAKKDFYAGRSAAGKETED